MDGGGNVFICYRGGVLMTWEYFGGGRVFGDDGSGGGGGVGCGVATVFRRAGSVAVVFLRRCFVAVILCS